jgi:hypothetical protein
VAHAEALFGQVVELGLEGIVAKRALLTVPRRAPANMDQDQESGLRPPRSAALMESQTL